MSLPKVDERVDEEQRRDGAEDDLGNWEVSDQAWKKMRWY
jgi:hypothetical protein